MADQLRIRADKPCLYYIVTVRCCTLVTDLSRCGGIVGGRSPQSVAGSMKVREGDAESAQRSIDVSRSVAIGFACAVSPVICTPQASLGRTA